MAASTATALKQVTENGSLGIAAYRDSAPNDALLPFVVFTDGISVVPVPSGDAGTGDHAIENVQGDLYERYVDDDDPDAVALGESYTLAPALRKLLHGAILPITSPTNTHSFMCRVAGSTRSVDKPANVVRTRLSINVTRDL